MKLKKPFHLSPTMEISAHFVPRSCFVSGDLVRCSVEFRLPSDCPSESCVVAWASAQMQCECVREDDAERALLADHHHHGRATSLRPVDWSEGSQIMSSAPKVGQPDTSASGSVLQCTLSGQVH